MTQPPSTVRDRTWLWVAQTGTFNDARWKVPGASFTTGDQACEELGVPNAIFIQWEGRPQPPFLEHAQGCAAARRLMWTAVNNCGGRASLAETEHFFELARAGQRLRRSTRRGAHVRDHTPRNAEIRRRSRPHGLHHAGGRSGPGRGAGCAGRRRDYGG